MKTFVLEMSWHVVLVLDETREGAWEQIKEEALRYNPNYSADNLVEVTSEEYYRFLGDE